MTNWKRGVVAGTLGAGVVLLLTGKRRAGIAVGTVGLAILASEYPDKFEALWRHSPDYVSRGIQIFQTVSDILDRFEPAGSMAGSRWGRSHRSA